MPVAFIIHQVPAPVRTISGMYILWFIYFGLIFLNQFNFYFPLCSIHCHKLSETKGNKTQTGLNIFKPKKNFEPLHRC